MDQSSRCSVVLCVLSTVLTSTACDSDRRDTVLTGERGASSLEYLYGEHWNYRLFEFLKVKAVTAYRRDLSDITQWWYTIELDRLDADQFRAMVDGATKRMIDENRAVVVSRPYREAEHRNEQSAPSGWDPSTLVGSPLCVELKVRPSIESKLEFVQETRFIYSRDDNRIFVSRSQL